MIEIADPERALSIAYAPAESRAALMALWTLDERLGQIVRTTSEPLIGRMRLTWWHEAIAALRERPPPAEPLLTTIADEIAMPEILLPLIDGWEVLLDPLPLSAEQLGDYAAGRGAGLFDAATAVLGRQSGDAVCSAGKGWALVDLAFHISDRATATAAIDEARRAFERAPRRWPNALRSIGMLARLAERDARAGLDAPRRPGSPSRLLRALGHRLTGR